MSEPRPENVTNDKLSANDFSNGDIRALLDAFVKPDQEISVDDFVATRRRARILLNQDSSLTEEDALKIGFMDRAINSASALGVSYDDAIHNSELAGMFIKDKVLAENDEFVQTVLNKAEDLYTAGMGVAYSDALAEAAKIRVKEFSQNKTIEGTIGKDGLAHISPERSN